MGILWAKDLKIGLRQKLAWGYALVFSILFALGFSSVYIISEKYRKEEFYQRLKDRTLSTYTVMVEVDQINYDMLRLFDQNTFNSLFDEKVLLFDSTLKLIYTNREDSILSYPKDVLYRLRNGTEEIQTQLGIYELVGIRFVYKGHVYYGITEAYDRFGKSKIKFLGSSLIIIFLLVLGMLIALSLYLSKRITNPITKLTSDIGSISTENLSQRIEKSQSNDEVALLTNKFNELLDRVENAFKFQYHFIHHISHELKTPLAVMIAHTEASLGDVQDQSIAGTLQFIRHSLMEMSHIINAMIDVSKTEHQLENTLSEVVRVDELLFECIDELSYLSQDYAFDFKMNPLIEDSDTLIVKGSSRMLKMALINLLRNAFNYADQSTPQIELHADHGSIQVKFYNDGSVISVPERDKLFTHLFRGQNSKNKKGFGLGLVLANRIVKLHRGTIEYKVTDSGNNLFIVSLPST